MRARSGGPPAVLSHNWSLYSVVEKLMNLQHIAHSVWHQRTLHFNQFVGQWD